MQYTSGAYTTTLDGFHRKSKSEVVCATAGKVVLSKNGRPRKRGQKRAFVLRDPENVEFLGSVTKISIAAPVVNEFWTFLGRKMAILLSSVT